MIDIENHLKEFPNAVMVEKGGRLYGHWMEGNFYKRAVDYYGAYPPSFLRRVYSLFPRRGRVLHLFSGAVRKGDDEYTIDINPINMPDVVGDVHKVSNYFEEDFFSMIIADPPYDAKHAEVYGTKMPRTHIIMQELYTITQSAGYVVWLSTRPPLYRKVEWELAGLIGLHTGTNRVYRCVCIMKSRKRGSF